MKKRKNNPDYFKDIREASVGFASMGIMTGVGAGIAAQAPAGTPNMMGGFTAMSGFAPVIGTAVGAKTVLNVLPKKKKIKAYGY